MRKAAVPTPNSAFTLIEICTVIVIISILMVMCLQVASGIKERANRSLCQNNLRNLFSAATNYLNDQAGVWPQIPTNDIRNPTYAQAWVSAYRPYGLASVNWICPSVQNVLGNMNYDHFPRVDYLGTAFGPTSREAFRYATQPWFIERADIHGDGNLLIFANGQVKSMKEVLDTAKSGPPPQQ